MKRRRPDNSILEGTPEEHARFEVELQRLQNQPEGADPSSWTPTLVRKFFLMTTPKVDGLIRTAMVVGSGCSTRELANAAGTRPNAIGPLVGKATRDAQDVGEDLPAPMYLHGGAGHTHVVIDEAFQAAFKQAYEGGGR